MSRPAPRPAATAYPGFAVFGALWGAWGASIPAFRDQADVTAGQLGTALLFIGAGALPAMPVAGRLVDRWGQRTAGALLLVLGAVGLLVAATGQDLLTLSVGLTALGAASGATDVAINAIAGEAQHSTGRPVLSRAHAVFSGSVVVSSLGTGTLHGARMPLVVPFAMVAAAGGIAALVIIASARTTPASRGRPPRLNQSDESSGPPWGPALILGALGALAFAVENGHQSWSALYFRDILHVDPATAAVGPATFAAIVAITRLGTAGLGTRYPLLLLVIGAILACIGTAALAAAGTVETGLLGLGIAAAGTAVLFPTLLTVLTKQVPDHARGTATSIVTTVAYLGFLGGPAYVGLWAEAIALPGAMTALAALAAVLGVLAPMLLRNRRPPPDLRPVGTALAETLRTRRSPLPDAVARAQPLAGVNRRRARNRD